MAKGGKAKTTLSDCEFLLIYHLFDMHLYEQFFSCRIVRGWQESSMQHMCSTACTNKQLDPERKSRVSFKVRCSHLLRQYQAQQEEYLGSWGMVNARRNSS